jgi:hypothetical protein
VYQSRAVQLLLDVWHQPLQRGCGARKFGYLAGKAGYPRQFQIDYVGNQR